MCHLPAALATDALLPLSFTADIDHTRLATPAAELRTYAMPIWTTATSATFDLNAPAAASAGCSATLKTRPCTGKLCAAM
jgi:hypothetical protein